MQDLTEALALQANEVFGRHLHAIEKDDVAVDRMPAELLDRADRGLRSVELSVEETEAVTLVLDLVERGRTREDKDLVGHLGGRDPDLLATDNIAITFSLHFVFDLRSVEANLRLRNCKTGLLLAPDDRRQHARLLLRRAEDDDRLQPDTVAHAILRGLHHRYARI